MTSSRPSTLGQRRGGVQQRGRVRAERRDLGLEALGASETHRADLGALGDRCRGQAGSLGLLFAIAYFLALPLRPWHAPGAAALIFTVAYPVFRFGLERFVHDRIKMLYRTVHDLRRGRGEAGATAKGDELDRANDDVAEWANERRSEIGDLQEREKYRREFIGNLAHELKTPIFNIQGYILTLLEGGLEDDKVNRNFLDRASNGVDRLLKIVEDLACPPRRAGV